jgi:uncharacterized protein YijF (DUF1287 family)
VTEDDRAKAASSEQLKNAGWAIAVALIGGVLVISSGRARVARAAAATPDDPLPASALTAVPMSVEPTDGPTKPPLSFVSAFTSSQPRTFLSSSEESAIVGRARLEIDRVTVYDSSWMETSSYPMGDVPASRGACTDVVVRSLRDIGVDLQELVHDDVQQNPHAYGLSSVEAVDPNIDHRRVSTMEKFFARNALSLTTSLRDKAAWRAGDVVFIAFKWIRGAIAEHVGIISDKIGPRGLPMVIENGGPKAAEQDSLGRGMIVGHYRALRKP